LQVVWVHLLAREVFVLFWLLLIFLVDFGFHIDELVAPLLSSTFARGLALQTVSIRVAFAEMESSYLYVVIFVLLVFLFLFLFFVLLVFLLLFLAALIVFNILFHIGAGLS
jgi:hypothetical protein